MSNKNRITLETRETKLEKIKKKSFRKTLFTTVMSMGVLLGCTGMLVGCGEAGPKGDTGATGPAGPQGAQGIQGETGAAGADGATWLTGTAITGTTNGISAEIANAKIGDLYFNTSTCDIYQCVSENTWNWISNIKGAQGETGKAGNMWTVGEGVPTATANKGDMYLDKTTSILYQMGETTWEEVGIFKGNDGKDGTSVYIGYDGYIWCGTEKTDFKVEGTILDENVVENTIGIEDTIMSQYFAGSYLDLSTNTVALMANYMPYAKLTQYGNATVTEIKVVADKAGTLYIGTAKVADVVLARTTGTTTYANSTTAYTVKAGLNTITFETPIEVAEDETIVLGGKGSVGLYTAQGVTLNDEDGNYTLVNGVANTDVISKTNEINDTLAIQVTATYEKVATTAVFPNILTDFPESTISGLSEVKYGVAPFRYQDDTLFAGKTITKIGIPLKTITEGATELYMTIYKVKTSITADYKANATETIKVTFPSNAAVDTWVYADCNISLAKDETIALGATGDTVWWGYKTGSTREEYLFNLNAGTTTTNNLVFDIYTSETTVAGLEDNLEKLQQKEEEASFDTKLTQLPTVLSGKNFSILGDSISTFSGSSNDSTNTNSTTGTNKLFYGGTQYEVTNVNMTWWKQVANDTGMNVLVNNSSAGDTVAEGGQTRSLQLHDDTGDNAGDTPDIIAVYMGVNDIKNSTTLTKEAFKSNYLSMVNNILTTYTDSDVFLFTIPQYTYDSANRVSITDEELEVYNDAIREIAAEKECGLVDLFANSGITAETLSIYTGEGLHPNAEGMDLITKCFEKVLIKKYLDN